MDPFFQLADTRFVELFFQKIFHRFHIVVGDGYDLFDMLRIFDAEFVQHFPQRRPAFGGEPEKLLVGEEEKVFDLNQYAVFDQSVFRKKIIKVIYLFAVTAIDGGNCSKLGEFHFN